MARSSTFPYQEIKEKYDCDHCLDSQVITTGAELDVCPCYYEKRAGHPRDTIDNKRFDVV